ncbi:MAG: aminopeptidase N [Methylococcaceae bacterium]|nr:aminopeptidase N [Methylococcaceae bacterium]
MRNPSPQTIHLKDYRVPEYLIHSVDLNIVLDEQKTRIVSRLTMQRNPACQSEKPALELLGEQLELVSVAIDGKPLSSENYQLSEESLTINAITHTQVFVLAIENTLNPSLNTALEGLYLSNGMLCTQCEAEGFRKITYYLDRPDVMATFTTTLIGDKDKYPLLLSNGNKVAAGELKNNRHWVTWEDPFAKPCYLFALVAGQLEVIEDSFTTMTGREIALQIFVEAHDKDKCTHAMQSLKDAMVWDEKVYGREYDLDLYMIVAVSHFNMGAMENKGLNVFNTKFVLASPDTATDADYEGIAGVIAHEYFHNWTGNRITCRDWFQLSLKEGFTVFRDQEFTADQTSKGVKRIEDVNLLRARQFAEDAGPLSHPIRPEAYIEINNFYTLTVYEKGAEVVRMLRTLLGEEGFRAGSDLYFERHDGQAVTCDDFVAAMAAANELDLSQFKRWYSQAGTPTIKASQYYDAAAKTLTLELEQHSSSPEPLHIPIKTALLYADGSAATIQLEGEASTEEMILHFTADKQRFVFQDLKERPVVSLLRDFSAPVKLEITQSLEELAFLLSYDSDPFNRWEAGQKLAATIIFALIDDLQQGRALSLNPMLIEAFEKVLAQEWDDLSYFSLLLALPAEVYLAEQMAVVDVDAIHKAREFVRLTLAENLQTQFNALYQQYNQDESGQFDAGAIGRRRIKNSCLSYLAKLETKDVWKTTATQFKTAGTMTDQIAALGMIVNSNHPEKNNSLEAFYQQWKDEALVVDKWFNLQASSSMPDTFSKIQDLMQHSAFDLKNPNRVRSLIGAFSQGNPVNYHAANGEGYQFLADQVIALNSLNPQVASRMVTALTQWRRFDEHRQDLMKAQLERIIQTENVSKDVYELASKSLA